MNYTLRPLPKGVKDQEQRTVVATEQVEQETTFTISQRKEEYAKKINQIKDLIVEVDAIVDELDAIESQFNYTIENKPVRVAVKDPNQFKQYLT